MEMLGLSCQFSTLKQAKVNVGIDHMHYLNNTGFYVVFIIDVDNRTYYYSNIEKGTPDATDFEDNYKDPQYENPDVEDGIAECFSECIPKIQRKNNTSYKSNKDIEATTNWQELDLGNTYTEIAIFNDGIEDIEIKLNDSGNDTITLDKKGSSDSALQFDFEVSSIFYRAVANTSLLKYLVTK